MGRQSCWLKKDGRWRMMGARSKIGLRWKMLGGCWRTERHWKMMDGHWKMKGGCWKKQGETKRRKHRRICQREDCNRYRNGRQSYRTNHIYRNVSTSRGVEDDEGRTENSTRPQRNQCKYNRWRHRRKHQ
jgi:hypothetical protein